MSENEDDDPQVTELAREMRRAGGLVLFMDAYAVFSVVGALQLALKHPHFGGNASVLVANAADSLIQSLADAGCPTAVSIACAAGGTAPVSRSVSRVLPEKPGGGV